MSNITSSVVVPQFDAQGKLAAIDLLTTDDSGNYTKTHDFYMSGAITASASASGNMMVHCKLVDGTNADFAALDCANFKSQLDIVPLGGSMLSSKVWVLCPADVPQCSMTVPKYVRMGVGNYTLTGHVSNDPHKVVQWFVWRFVRDNPGDFTCGLTQPSPTVFYSPVGVPQPLPVSALYFACGRYVAHMEPAYVSTDQQQSVHLLAPPGYSYNHGQGPNYSQEFWVLPQLLPHLVYVQVSKLQNDSVGNRRIKVDFKLGSAYHGMEVKTEALKPNGKPLTKDRIVSVYCGIKTMSVIMRIPAGLVPTTCKFRVSTVTGPATKWMDSLPISVV